MTNDREIEAAARRALGDVLAVKRSPGAELEVLGRRRTKAELLQMLNARAAIERNTARQGEGIPVT